MEVIPAAEGVLELLLAGDAGLEPRDAAGGEILGQVPRPFDGDAIAVEPPVGRVLGRRNQPALDAAPLDLQPERGIVLRMARLAPELLLEAAALSASRGARGLLRDPRRVPRPTARRGRPRRSRSSDPSRAGAREGVCSPRAGAAARATGRATAPCARSSSCRTPRRRSARRRATPVVVQAFGLSSLDEAPSSPSKASGREETREFPTRGRYYRVREVPDFTPSSREIQAVPGDLPTINPRHEKARRHRHRHQQHQAARGRLWTEDRRARVLSREVPVRLGKRNPLDGRAWR